MFDKKEIERYQRQIKLSEISFAGQKKLKTAKVLVVGAGGLGSPVLKYLAAAGIGNIGIFDGDTVSLSNLQRQILYATADIGKPKAETAAQHLLKLNPNIQIFYRNEFFNTSHSAGMAPYDVVIDCTDNYEARIANSLACREHKKPMVYGAVFRFEGQISVFNYNGSKAYHEIFTKEQTEKHVQNEEGIIGAVPAVIGSLQVCETVKIILGIGQVLSGKLLYYNALKSSFYEIAL